MFQIAFTWGDASILHGQTFFETKKFEIEKFKTKMQT